MSRIVKLQSENVKRLSACSIEPDGSVVIIGGANGAGKSSVLDSIEYALGGKTVQCEMPLRVGTEKGYTVVETDDVIVKRTFSPRGTSLRVFSKDGMEYKSPQKILDAMVGSLAFDPLAFMRKKSQEQAATLRELFGIDVSDIEAKRKAAYDDRTDTNRRVAETTAQLKAFGVYDDVPDDEVPTSTVLEELDAVQKINHDNDKRRQDLIAIKSTMDNRLNDCAEIREQIEALSKRLIEINDDLDELRIQKADFSKVVEDLTDVDEESIRARLNTLDDENSKVRANKARKAVAASLVGLQKASQEFTETIAMLDKEKASRFEKAEIPVPGIIIDEGRVIYNDIPLEQCSQAEQLRVSVAMGMAQNSNLRVMLIREGALLDENSLAMLKELAEENDTQIWLEVVGDRDDCSVVIEDGCVKDRAAH